MKNSTICWLKQSVPQLQPLPAYLIFYSSCAAAVVPLCAVQLVPPCAVQLVLPLAQPFPVQELQSSSSRVVQCRPDHSSHRAVQHSHQSPRSPAQSPAAVESSSRTVQRPLQSRPHSPSAAVPVPCSSAQNSPARLPSSAVSRSPAQCSLCLTQISLCLAQSLSRTFPAQPAQPLSS
ncbi:hypothetical protein Acr_00g0068200 [Actinidia rufa]|uniref:Uncharacterized protein n=1 Tax=Actinidia rufa TaxID=165716 RepID=A0A7J0DQM5_9ERIC|nr:hypothetical protein Acr_00g0068200 [Actinidia rufa]